MGLNDENRKKFKYTKIYLENKWITIVKKERQFLMDASLIVACRNQKEWWSGWEKCNVSADRKFWLPKMVNCQWFAPIQAVAAS
jgi:hypothetical protein